MIKKEVIVEKDRKIIDFLQDFGFSYADSNKILKNKDVKVDGKVEKNNISLRAGQKIAIFYNEDMLNKRYEKVFEDENVLLVYKFSGIETDGAKGLSAILGVRAVHRLDRNTEGLVIFAKNEKTAEILEKAFKNRQIHKFYVAEVVGKFEVDNTFEAFLLKDSENCQVKILAEVKKVHFQLKLV